MVPMEKVFLNDRLVDAGEASLAVNDSGFLYGMGLFETMRACHGVVFGLNDHIDRLFFSASVLSIRNSYGREHISKAVYELLRANALEDARLRLTLTAGPMDDARDARSTLLITATALKPYPCRHYSEGVLVVLSPFRQTAADPVCGHKTVNYLSRMLALDVARRAGAAEALWFTADNRLAEGCISNVFLVKDSVLYSPGIETPVLAGVARKTVCRIAVDRAMPLVEKDLHISDCLEADEVFLTNVIMKVMPVVRIERHSVGGGRVGPLTGRISRYFDDVVEKACSPAGTGGVKA
jgi:branched-chain amino acid aminotransferase